jgi:hypothetical protein
VSSKTARDITQKLSWKGRKKKKERGGREGRRVGEGRGEERGGEERRGEERRGEERRGEERRGEERRGEERRGEEANCQEQVRAYSNSNVEGSGEGIA